MTSIPITARQIQRWVGAPQRGSGLGLASVVRMLKSGAAAILIVALATICAEILDRIFGLTRLSPVFLSAVVVTGVWLGARPAIIAAFAAFLVYNFYIVEPRFTFSLASAEDYLNLVLFLTIALLTGSLAGRLRDEGNKAQARAEALGALYDASRQMSVLPDPNEIWEDFKARVAAVSGSEILICSQPDVAGPLGIEDGRLGKFIELCKSRAATAQIVREGDLCGRVLQDVGEEGWLVVWRTAKDQPGGFDADRLVTLLIDLAAANVARAHVTDARAEAEAMARAERLRTALLSSLSHDLRTPLSAILASASSLADFGEAFDHPTRRDLALNIQEEAEVLSRFVANLLSMTRLESEAIEINAQRVRIADLVNEVIDRFERRSGERRIIATARSEALAFCDPVLLAQALTNIVDNALSFSASQEPVELTVERRGESVEIRCSDYGPGVPTEALQVIFQKFHRISDAQSRQGSGLGLSIAKGLIEAMEGEIFALARSDGRSGLVVVIRLPVTHEN